MNMNDYDKAFRNAMQSEDNSDSVATLGKVFYNAVKTAEKKGFRRGVARTIVVFAGLYAYQKWRNGDLTFVIGGTSDETNKD